ncbi:metal ABC transporter ATP-binding protein [Jiella sp. M17.18]|uniref:metal ABC transporter ATP-binding protein n=1 Tax=Jiella sp. M17.18 TaxID=3234247 RepID=UPI0034DEE6EB
MTAVAFDNVVLSLGARTVLESADFAIRTGEFVGLLGPNGAGKTTLLRAILGLLAPARGTITVLGRPASRGNRLVGYMPQHRRLPGGTALTGWDYVAGAAGGWRWGLPTLGSRERDEVAWALETVGAADLARRSLHDLSGGERQRLLISQAIIGRPKLLLLDEPLISLDPTHQRGVVELAKRLQTECRMTVLFSAHELNPLIGALDRVLYLGRGKAVLGEVDDVVTGPVLSALYGSQIEVLRMGARRFVLTGESEIGAAAHRHDEHAHGPSPEHDTPLSRAASRSGRGSR